jgi:hypothetical protein
MKKQIIILSFLFFTCIFLWSQNFVKITSPCTAEYLRNLAGRWIQLDVLYAKISKQQQQEIFNRLDKIHQFVFTIYPSPLGIDAIGSRFTSDDEFAYQVKIDHLPEGRIHETFVNGTPVVIYSYTAKFSQHSCGRNTYEMRTGYPREEGSIVKVVANSLVLLPHSQRGPGEMSIEGREIRTMPVVKGKWKGYTLYTPETGSGVTMVLLHREGMLPFIPVSRKQYLDLSISYLNKWYDKMVADIDKNAKAFIDAGMTDSQSIKEQKEKLQKQKDLVLRHYRDELTTTTAAGLQETPAILFGIMCDPVPTNPIFSTEAAGGRMLTTENPAYFRRDLPKYIPQFFVLSFEKHNWPFAPKEDPMKLLDENFPVEKLQAMIDK